MMFKALFKKQLMEVNSWLLQDKKKGKRRTGAGMAGMIVLYLFLFFTVGILFYGMGNSMCAPLVMSGLGWLYFALMGMIAVVMGVFGSVFNTYSTLYQAKDNELLLSLPIPPSYILAVRLFGVWMWGLIYESLVFVPVLAVYWKTMLFVMPAGSFRWSSVVTGFVLLLALSGFVLALTCVLGWVVAQIARRLKNKSFATVAASVVFLGLYYYVYFNAYTALQKLLVNMENIAQAVKGWLLPLYWMGRAGEGDFVSLLLTAALVAGIFALTYLVLERSFVRMATAGSGSRRRTYREKAAKRKDLPGALLGREVGRFTSSATYMLNCALGTLMMPAAGVAALIFRAEIRGMVEMLGQVLGAETVSGLMVPVLCASGCFLAGMNDITAPSVSLEGKNLWIIQSLPVDPWQALKAKLKLHVILTEIPMIFAMGCMIWVIRPGVTGGALMLLIPGIFVVFNGAWGLVINLKNPNLTWKDETVPVKQSFGVLICMLGSWILAAGLGGLYLLLADKVSGEIYLLLVALILGLVTGGMIRWIRTRGARIYAEL